jgi:DNA-binding GntR family transcriptional regulator
MNFSLDGYILDVLMRDLTEHEKRPSAFLVYLHIWRQTLGAGQRTARLSYQDMAEGTGLSKSAVQGAVRLLRRRHLISVSRNNSTATPIYRPERPWIRRKQA